MRIATVLVLLCLNSALAQETAEVLTREQVEAYLEVVSDAEAEERLLDMLKAPHEAQEVLSWLTAPPPAFGQETRLELPFENTALRVRVLCPEGHGPDSDPLPLALHIRLGRIPDTVTIPGAVNVWVDGFDPERGSESLRAGFSKVLRHCCWRFRGDPRRLWMTGFSWGAQGVFDLVLHRPGLLRGFVAMAGCPARKDFRLLPNLRGLEVFAFSGAQDDPEMIWNLEELGRRAAEFRFAYEFETDPDVPGRLYPSPKSVPRIGPLVAGSSGLERPTEGRFHVDAEILESPDFVVTKVKAKSVAIPRRIPVSAAMDFDERRQATIAAMEKKVASFDWSIALDDETLVVDLETKGVEKATLLLRRSRLSQAKKLVFRGAKSPRKPQPVVIDVAAMLRECRRSGERLDPVLMIQALRF